MSFGTMFTILFTWYFQSLGINLGFLATALLAIPFGIIITILYVLVKDKLVFSYYRTQKSPPVMLAMVSIGTMFITQAIVRIVIGPFDRRFFDGEKFIISLSLALALSDLASSNVRIDSLFIDEGFGTLDSNTLETVISTLETLQSQGKMIGIISHVENLKERIPTQIQITKKSNGVSSVNIV